MKMAILKLTVKRVLWLRGKYGQLSLVSKKMKANATSKDVKGP